MKIFDTDHATILQIVDSGRRQRIVDRIAGESESVGIPVIVVEESMRGWMASIAKELLAIRQVSAYRALAGLFKFYASYTIVPFDSDAANEFETLKSMKVRISTRDLKIASIARSRHATVITANRRDFEKVPGLKIENWLD